VTVALVSPGQWKWKRQQIAVSIISIIITTTRQIEDPYNLHHRRVELLSADITECLIYQTKPRERASHQAISVKLPSTIT
jgi:hypothetical protein